jgi:transposase-like protein
MIVEMALTGNYSINQIARDHDLAPGLVISWRRQMEEGSMVPGPTARERKLEAELEIYKKKVGELTILTEIVKKHLDIFLQEKRQRSLLVSPRKLAVLDGRAK